MASLGTGQTLGDRLNAARYAITGQGLTRAVCKATTEEQIAPKKKHIDYLIACTHEPNVSIPQMASAIIERSQHPNWVVCFKALVTTHHLMCFGNERYTQYLASSSSTVFHLSTYLDRSGGKSGDMSIFIRRYAKYLNTKAASYRSIAFDPCKIKRGKPGATSAELQDTMHSFSIDKLLKVLPVIQTQVDHLVEFDCTASDLTNSIINAAFYLQFKDLVRIFAVYNEGVISILEKYFDLTSKKAAAETLEIYKKFIIRMDKIADFLKIAEQLGIDRGEIPGLAKPPTSLVEAMDQHLAYLEGKKPPTAYSAIVNGSGGENGGTNSAEKAIAEEEEFLNKLKEKHIKEKNANNPFLSLASPVGASASSKLSDMFDLFTATETANSTAAAAAVSTASGISAPSSTSRAAVKSSAAEDLFSLQTSGTQASARPSTTATTPIAANNPFADIINSIRIPSGSVPGSAPNGSISTGVAAAAAAAISTGSGAGKLNGFDAFGGGGSSANANFATSDGFAAAFGSSSNSNVAFYPRGFDAFGDVLQPHNVSTIPGGSAGPPTTFTAVNNNNNNNNNNSNNRSQMIGVPSLSSSGVSSSLQSGGVVNFNVPSSNSSGGKAASASSATAVAPASSSSSSSTLLKGDLESSLANLVQNLDINGPKGSGGFTKNRSQFNQSSNATMKTGAPMSNSTSAPSIALHHHSATGPAIGGPSLSPNSCAWNTTGAITGAAMPSLSLSANPIGVWPSSSASSTALSMPINNAANSSILPTAAMMSAAAAAPGWTQPTSPIMPIMPGQHPSTMAINPMTFGMIPGVMNLPLTGMSPLGSSNLSATTNTIAGNKSNATNNSSNTLDPFGAL